MLLWYGEVVVRTRPAKWPVRRPNTGNSRPTWPVSRPFLTSQFSTIGLYDLILGYGPFIIQYPASYNLASFCPHWWWFLVALQHYMIGERYPCNVRTQKTVWRSNCLQHSVSGELLHINIQNVA